MGYNPRARGRPRLESLFYETKASGLFHETKVQFCGLDYSGSKKVHLTISDVALITGIPQD